jgi:short-subunit dehydrogenase
LLDARIVVTGASSGIGRELALALAGKRARLWLVARREPLLAKLAVECQRLGAGAEYAVGDATDPAFRAALFAEVAARWTALDVLINNAGVSVHNRFAEGDADELRRIMEVNFFAPAELVRLALPLLRAGRRPAIVNVASVLGCRGAPFNSEYCASKFALRGWSQSLRAELAADKIDVLLASPGTVDTEFFDHLLARRASPPWGKSRGVPASEAARQIVEQLERGRREIFPNWRGRLLVLANRLAPGLVDRVMKRLAR